MLYQIRPIFEEPEIIDGYGTFPQFLADFGKSLSQVKPLMDVGAYLSMFEEDDELLLIPISKLQLAAKYGLGLDEELKHELLTLSYTALKDKYAPVN